MIQYVKFSVLFVCKNIASFMNQAQVGYKRKQKPAYNMDFMQGLFSVYNWSCLQVASSCKISLKNHTVFPSFGT